MTRIIGLGAPSPECVAWASVYVVDESLAPADRLSRLTHAVSLAGLTLPVTDSPTPDETTALLDIAYRLGTGWSLTDESFREWAKSVVDAAGGGS